jgi:hypothetical protein
MSTKKHKSATTTSDILPTNPSTLDPQPSSPSSSSPLDTQHSGSPSPSTLNTRHSATPFLTTRARCGKVARLPKEIRDQINEMLLDGIPHIQIIQKLKQTFATKPNVLPLDPADAPSNPDPSDSAHATRNSQHDSPSPTHGTLGIHDTPDTPSTPDTQHSDVSLP